MGRIHGGERYQRYFKYLVWAMMACVVIWLTPHTLMMSSGEVKAMGGAQHPVIGNYGVMSAKNGAINVMICLTGLSYILYRRGEPTLPVSRLTVGKSAVGGGFLAGGAHQHPVGGVSVFFSPPTTAPLSSSPGPP